MRKIKEINMGNIIIIALLIVEIVLSFFPCLNEYVSGSADNFASSSFSGKQYNSAGLCMLFLGVCQITLLVFNKKSLTLISCIISLLSAIFTLIYPVIMMLNHSMIGQTSEFLWTLPGWINLILEWIIFILLILVYKITFKRE